MKDKYLLTIAIPTYNGSKTILNMLDRLLLECDERVQVIISDNASTDETEQLMRDRKAKYTFVNYVRNEKNIGPDSNFLQCMRLAEGKYTWLLSDDDILMEGKLKIILDFLARNDDCSLLYLNAKGFHETYVDEEHCEFYERAVYDGREFVTFDKKVFMQYAGRMWGFLSCFIFLTRAFQAIEQPERFKKTYWLQSYIHVLCADYGEKRLGVISQPCIGAGIYSNVSNFDSGMVDGVYYRQLLNFCVQHGFDKRQLDNLFVWRICFIFKRSLIKERASGIKRSSVLNVIKCTWRYPAAWVSLYPYFFLPPIVCRIAVNINNRIKGYKNRTTVSRQGDVAG